MMKKLICIVLILLLAITSEVLSESSNIESYNLRVTSDKEGEDFQDLKIVYKLFTLDHFYELTYNENFIKKIKEDNDFIISNTIDINDYGDAYLDKKIINDNLDDIGIIIFYLIDEKNNYILEDKVVKLVVEKDMLLEDCIYEIIDTNKKSIEGNYLNAKFKDLTHIVSFINGDICLVENIKHNEKAKPLEVENLNGYEFIGWHLDGKLFDFNTNITEDLSLIAQFKKINVIINKPKIEVPDTGIWH